MTEDAIRGIEFACVESGYDETVTVGDTARVEGEIIVYESYIPPYIDVYAWYSQHVADIPDAELKKAVKTGEFEWGPRFRELST